MRYGCDAGVVMVVLEVLVVLVVLVGINVDIMGRGSRHTSETESRGATQRGGGELSPGELVHDESMENLQVRAAGNQRILHLDQDGEFFEAHADELDRQVLALLFPRLLEVVHSQRRRSATCDKVGPHLGDVWYQLVQQLEAGRSGGVFDLGDFPATRCRVSRRPRERGVQTHDDARITGQEGTDLTIFTNNMDQNQCKRAANCSCRVMFGK